MFSSYGSHINTYLALKWGFVCCLVDIKAECYTISQSKILFFYLANGIELYVLLTWNEFKLIL